MVQLQLDAQTVAMFKAISTKIQLIKQAYLAKEPLEKWDVIRSYGNILLWFGCDFMRRDYKLTPLSYLPGIVAIDFFIVVCSTFYYYRHQLLLPLQSFTILGLVIPVNFLTIFFEILHLNKNFNLFSVTFAICAAVATQDYACMSRRSFVPC